MKPSSLGPLAGLGLFACGDILVPQHMPVDLFQFFDAIYSNASWQIICGHVPSIANYSINVDANRAIPVHLQRIVDGDPVRGSNIAGYINSAYGFRKVGVQTNVSFQIRPGRPKPNPYVSASVMCDFHIIVVAKQNITKGDELLAGYDPAGGPNGDYNNVLYVHAIVLLCIQNV